MTLLQSLQDRVEMEMTVVKGGAADISAEEVVDCIEAATRMGTYWRENRGPHGYLNGEIRNAHHSEEDYAGAQAVKGSVAFRKAEAAARAVVGPGFDWDRVFVNARLPLDPESGAQQGLHDFHQDTRKSTVIVSVRVNYVGNGAAGDIVYGLGKRGERGHVQMLLEHGDVAVYTQSLHHVDLADDIFHKVSPNPSATVTTVTFMFESRNPLPRDFIDNLKTRAPALAKPPVPGLPPHRPLSSCLIPYHQTEKGSHQRFTDAERLLGGRYALTGRSVRGSGGPFGGWGCVQEGGGESEVHFGVCPGNHQTEQSRAIQQMIAKGFKGKFFHTFDNGKTKELDTSTGTQQSGGKSPCVHLVLASLVEHSVR